MGDRSRRAESIEMGLIGQSDYQEKARSLAALLAAIRLFDVIKGYVWELDNSGSEKSGFHT
jgi:hypothetical protein